MVEINEDAYEEFNEAYKLLKKEESN